MSSAVVYAPSPKNTAKPKETWPAMPPSRFHPRLVVVHTAVINSRRMRLSLGLAFGRSRSPASNTHGRMTLSQPAMPEGALHAAFHLRLNKLESPLGMITRTRTNSANGTHRLVAGRQVVERPSVPVPREWDGGAENFQNSQNDCAQRDSGNRFQAAEYDDHKGPQQEGPAEIRAEGIKHAKQRSGKSGEGRSQTEGKACGPLVVNSHDLVPRRDSGSAPALTGQTSCGEKQSAIRSCKLPPRQRPPASLLGLKFLQSALKRE